MLIICLGNKVHCCGNRDDILTWAAIKINRKLLFLEFSCLNEWIIVVKCLELSFK